MIALILRQKASVYHLNPFLYWNSGGLSWGRKCWWLRTLCHAGCLQLPNQGSGWYLTSLRSNSFCWWWRVSVICLPSGNADLIKGILLCQSLSCLKILYFIPGIQRYWQQKIVPTAAPCMGTESTLHKEEKCSCSETNQSVGTGYQSSL